MKTLKQHIFLIGFMGSGKTTNGKKIANKLNMPFLDLDDAFVNQEGISIQEYFATFGEDKFREVERDILQQTETLPPTVIATGGGAPCYFDNMDWMNHTGKTLYLNLSPEALTQRLANSKHNKRPLVSGKSEQEILEIVIEKMEQRKRYYDKAHHHIDMLKATLEEIIELL